MNVEQIGFLSSDAGTRALELAAHMPADRLTRIQRLRREFADWQAAGIVELLELHTRARAKFTDAEQMFFTPEGLEQSTGETIAAYRAGRFPADVPVLDACCGIGGDALHLRRCGTVLAVDRNPTAAACAHANARALPIAHAAPVHSLCADVTTLNLPRLRDQGIGAAFFDPSRRVDTPHGRARARTSEDYLPPLSWLNALTAHFPFAAVKVSPAIEDDALAQIGGRVEFIADGNECKEAVMWFGQAAERFDNSQALFREEPYCATVLRSGQPPQTLTYQHEEAAAVSAPRAWLYEPNAAVIRAHLVSQVAIAIEGALIDSQIAYLTADRFVPTPFATAYRIVDWMPYHPKNLLAWLRTNRRRVDVVKKRGVALEPEEVRKRLSSPALADNPPVTLVLARRGEKTIALLCEPLQTQDAA